MTRVERIELARLCLEGLSVGDSYGECCLRNNGLPPDTDARWPYTDDTQMALSVVSTLCKADGIDQDFLAQSFADHYEDWRGYGPVMHSLLARIADHEHWVEAAKSLFSGQGSFGNGAAMRVAPVGAYFSEDVAATAVHAARSAEVTHAHPEGIAGAIAVAIAAASACSLRQSPTPPEGSEFLKQLLPHIPLSTVQRKLQQASELGHTSLETAIRTLGNGSRISAQDTVPFALWCAAWNLKDYEQAVRFTSMAMGDCDTNCAIVGGVVVLSAGLESIPAAWLSARESLPHWPWQ